MKDRERLRFPRRLALDAGTDAMSVMRALVDELDEDPELAERVCGGLAAAKPGAGEG